MGRLTDNENYCIKTGCSACAGGVGIGCYEEKIYNKLKEYETLEEQGEMIILPVAEGATVYALGYIMECEYDYECKGIDAYKCECNEYCEHEYKVYRITESKFQKTMLPMIGKNIFLTKAEAEKALAEMEK